MDPAPPPDAPEELPTELTPAQVRLAMEALRIAQSLAALAQVPAPEAAPAPTPAEQLRAVIDAPETPAGLADPARRAAAKLDALAAEARTPDDLAAVDRWRAELARIVIRVREDYGSGDRARQERALAALREESAAIDAEDGGSTP